jgi:hypothetical protein
MKFAAYMVCWPLLGVFAVMAFVTDSMIDVCEGLDCLLSKLEDYVEAE